MADSQKRTRRRLTIEEERDQIKATKAKLRDKEKRLNAKIAKAKRTLDTRRKLLAGVVFLGMLEDGSDNTRQRLIGELNKRLTIERDREVFEDLLPAKVVIPKAKSPLDFDNGDPT